MAYTWLVCRISHLLYNKIRHSTTESGDYLQISPKLQKNFSVGETVDFVNDTTDLVLDRLLLP
ncbi:MAG: hypothetical protein II333_11420, partial [Clostridia bacterium]|nr:hypothetical protein [Clostridia bacterium]